MVAKFVIDTLVSMFNEEIFNEIKHMRNKIVINLKDGSRVKISTKNVA